MKDEHASGRKVCLYMVLWDLGGEGPSIGMMPDKE